MAAKTAIIISHYNLYSTLCLESLIAQIQDDFETGHAHCFVVVNFAQRKILELPGLRRPVSILYRENTGMNIGAWDHGWRAAFNYDNFIFLQEECRILRVGWLAAYLERLSDTSIGLIGESINADMSWEQFLNLPSRISKSVWRRVHSEVLALGIEMGSSSRHLQSLIWGARRSVLEKIGGFPIGMTKMQCIGSEVGVSLKVQSAGLRVELVGDRPFSWISHPQWDRNAG
ncbi:glycosyltransferase family A protein [Plastoroseomonas arctica]|uniref:Glycosyltransferase family 2 protein n=1 Tax=Plastoroseomonas arctica TaxID=1509237 RepID=A0AAF1JZZ4_9PROT|nr:glycosyltransferase family A protein [Plastoroseomonas arctica]MBR0657310.1 glycosyltransferase family 2 protein [Plastoroseomonas arctica]